MVTLAAPEPIPTMAGVDYLPPPPPAAAFADFNDGLVVGHHVTERAYAFYGRDAMATGIMALLLVFLPCVNLIAGPMALVGIVLGAIGAIKCHTRSQRGMVYSIVGLVLSALVGMFWFFIMGVAFFANWADRLLRLLGRWLAN